MAIRLIVLHQNRKMAIELKDGAYQMGRDPKGDVVIPDSTVSSHHAELQIQGTQCVLRDLGSSNGTFVNDERIRAAKEIKPGDSIRLGAVPLNIEVVREVKEKSAGVAPTARIEAQKARVAEAKSRIPWAVRYWLAGAIAILMLMLILIFVQLYSEQAGSELRIMHRFQALAAQYVHQLAANQNAAVPPPFHDESIAEPIMILNKDGQVLYPARTADESGELPASPLVDAKTGKVYETAKYGLKRIDVRPAKGQPPVEVRSYPIRSGGDLLGFVMAQPAVDSESALGNILLMIFLAGVIALIVLHFTLKPVNTLMRQQLANIQSKMSAYANGFIDTIPRSANFPELNALAAEAESVIQSASAGGKKTGERGGDTRSEFDPLMPDLLDTADVPWCFVDGDFRVLSRGTKLSQVAELNRAVIGNSIFESGMTNVQSKQLVQAIAEARSGREGRVRLTLTWQNDARDHDVSVRAFSDPGRGGQIFGLVFNPI